MNYESYRLSRGQILSPLLGDIVDSAWHRVVVPARQATTLCYRVGYILQSGTKNLASGVKFFVSSGGLQRDVYLG
jgi:hypothetical protein